MAVNYASKYSNIIDEKFALGALTHSGRQMPVKSKRIKALSGCAKGNTYAWNSSRYPECYICYG